MYIEHVLVIDDEPANCDFAVRLFRTLKLQVQGASSAAQAIICAQEMPRLDLAIIDHELPDSKGVVLLEQFRAKYPAAILAMATMHDHRALIDEAFEVGADIFLVKPHGFMELHKRIPQALGCGEDSCLRGWIIDAYGPRQRKTNVPVLVPIPAHTDRDTQRDAQ